MNWVLLPLFLLMHASASIPVLALSDTGEIISGEMEEAVYVDTLKTMKKAVDENIASGVLAREISSGWELSKFTVGLGLTGELGVGPFKYSSTIKQRFVYTR